MSPTRVLFVGVSMSLVAVACTGGSDSADDSTPASVAESTPTSESDSDGSDEPFVEASTDKEDGRQPLTGQPLEDDETVLSRPALAVKIDNHPDARPNHAGLAVADIVYEEIVENGQTRFVAVFHSTGSNPVGPLRSSRSQDVPLLEPLNVPLFASSGANPGVNRLVAEAAVVDLSEQIGADGYFRGVGISPHDLYNDTESLWEQTPDDHPGPPTQLFTYLAEGEEFAGETASGFTLRIGELIVDWSWDPEATKWRRFQDGVAHLDVANGPVMATNVVVMVVAYGRSAIDLNSPEARTVGDGLALIFNDGQVVEGRWERAAPGQPVAFLDQAGEPIALTPGNTWIELAAGDPTNPVSPVDFYAVI